MPKTKARTPNRAEDPPQAPGRRERKAAGTRLRLYRRAIDLYVRRGHENVGIEHITEAADVGKGTFFNYFDSKEHIAAMMAELHLVKAEQAAEKFANRDVSTRSSLHAVARGLGESVSRHPRLARAAVAALSGPAGARSSLRDSYDDCRKIVSRLVVAGQSRGEIDARLSRERIVTLFFESHLGTLLLWSLYEKPRLQTAIDHSFELFWRAIAAPPRRKGQPRRVK